MRHERAAAAYPRLAQKVSIAAVLAYLSFFLREVTRLSSKLDGVVGDESILIRISQIVRPCVCDVDLHSLVQVRCVDHQIHSFHGHPRPPPGIPGG